MLGDECRIRDVSRREKTVGEYGCRRLDVVKCRETRGLVGEGVSEIVYRERIKGELYKEEEKQAAAEA